MLRTNELKRKSLAGAVIRGLFNFVADPTVVELIASAGYDFVVIDTEHTLVGAHRLEHLIRAADAAGVVPLVRVPLADPAAMVRALDAGAMGIVVPRISRRSQVDDVIRATRYFPAGERGLNGGRMTGFGRIDLTDYLALANSETVLAIMIEDQQGVDELPTIVAGGGVDLVISGTADLSQSLGVPWELDHPAVSEAEQRIHTGCRDAGVAFCALTRGPEHYRGWYEAGVRTFILGNDRGLAARALHDHLGRHDHEQASR